jgi:hypothetical protein
MAACGRGIAPYAAVAGGELTTAKREAELGPTRDRVDDAEPAPAPPPTRWIKSLASYDRRHSSEIHGSRFG